LILIIKILVCNWWSRACWMLPQFFVILFVSHWQMDLDRKLSEFDEFCESQVRSICRLYTHYNACICTYTYVCICTFVIILPFLTLNVHYVFNYFINKLCNNKTGSNLICRLALCAIVHANTNCQYFGWWDFMKKYVRILIGKLVII
jgi:hypothetical protein